MFLLVIANISPNSCTYRNSKSSADANSYGSANETANVGTVKEALNIPNARSISAANIRAIGSPHQRPNSEAQCETHQTTHGKTDLRSYFAPYKPSNRRTKRASHLSAKLDADSGSYL